MNLSGFKAARDWLSWRSLVIIAPVFLLTVKGWIGAVTVLAFVGATAFLVSQRATLASLPLSPWQKALALALCGPFMAVVIAQTIRGQFYLPNWDNTLRLVFAAVIFVALCKGWLSRPARPSVSELWLRYSFPACMIWTLVDRPAWTSAWGSDRITTYFVDPLSFGSLCLLIAVLSLVGLSFYWSRMSVGERLLSGLGGLCGLYLSAQSGSRTGWLALPIVLLLWAWLFGVRAYGRRLTWALVLLGCLAALAMIALQPVLTEKIQLAIQEIIHYQWNGMNEDGSVAMRISFYRMALFYLSQNPWGGWGDVGWMQLMHSPELAVYASEFTRNFPKNGFHNEVLTSAVRSGVWGLISSLCLFMVPIAWCTRQIRQQAELSGAHLSALAALFFVLHLFITGMTTEVTHLIFLASFVGLGTAVLTSEARAAIQSPQPTNSAS